MISDIWYTYVKKLNHLIEDEFIFLQVHIYTSSTTALSRLNDSTLTDISVHAS